MKKITHSLLRWPAYYRMCSTDVYCSKQTGSSSTKGNHHPSFLRFWNWAEENCRCSKICGGAENVVKTETQQTFVNGLLGFITLGIYTPLEALILLLTIIAGCPSIWATLSLLINILLGSFQLFLHSDQPLSEGEIIPFSGVCQSGEAALSTPEAVVASRTDWQTALMCNRRRPAATSSRRASFSLWHQLTPSLFCIERSNITLTHLHVSNCRVRQLQFSGIFVSWAL